MPGLHDLGEADDGVERRAQLVAHIGEEFRLRLVGFLGAVLLLGVALGEIARAVRSAAPASAARCAGRRTVAFKLLLALDQLLFVALQRGDVGADRDEAAVLGAPLADLQPAAVVELRLEGARAGHRAALARRAACARSACCRPRRCPRRACPGATASSGRSCRLWNLELQSTSRLSASHSTKASEIASIASRSRISAVALSSASGFCSVMSTAMPMRCWCGFAGLAHELAARAQPDPVAARVAHAEDAVDRGRAGIGKLALQARRAGCRRDERSR